MSTRKMVEVTTDELAGALAEGMHTGLRKGSDADDSHYLWKMISDSKTDAWGDAAEYCAWGLKEMGYKVMREE